MSNARATIDPSALNRDRFSELRKKLSQGTVHWGPQAARIFSLPRRGEPDKSLVAEMTQRLKRDGGTQELRLLQAWALSEAPVARGLLANLALGAGKTILGLLMPMVWPGCKRAVLLIPPKLRVQLLEHDWEFYGRHWVLPNLAGGQWFVTGRPMLHVVTYSELSSPSNPALLEDIKPDLIMGDEIHRIARFESARTKRFFRYLAANKHVCLCGWSGTIASDSIRDFAYLAAAMLGDRSPVPYSEPELTEWAAALDAGAEDRFIEPGVLAQLCVEGESVRSGFHRRLSQTFGVVCSKEDELGNELAFTERKAPEMPKEITLALADVRKSTEPKRPDGEILLTPLDELRCARQLAQGFYMKWEYPRGEPEELRKDWFHKRQLYNRELREKLKNAQAHLDSPKLCENAVERFYKGGCTGCDRGPEQDHADDCREAKTHPLWNCYSWPYWKEIRDKVYHETRVVWVSDFLLNDAAAWATDKVGIVWVESPEFGHRLSKMTKRPYYGEGVEASRGIAAEDGERSVILSVRANSEGLNLQDRFHRNLFVTFPSDAKAAGQAVGRTHRPGQKAPEVEVYFYQHTRELMEGIDQARKKARFSTDVAGAEQKLVVGTWVML